MKKSPEYLRREILKLLDGIPPSTPEESVYLEMLFNVGLLREEKLDIAELRLLHTAFKELRYALTVFRRYRTTKKAAVFGSARTPKHHPDYRMAQEFGHRLAHNGWMVITGGASGIMEAVMEGAGARSSFGLNILLPFEQEANPIIKGNPKLMFFKYFFTRKLMFLKESDATVLFPGGFGTFDEGFESFTLVQTGKAKPRPLVVVDTPQSRFWDSILGVLKGNMEGGGLVSQGDFALMRHFQSPEAAVNEIVRFYSNYHSSRFLRDQYLIRLNRHLGAEELRALNRDFHDMLMKGGRFERMKDISDDDEKDPKLDRIVFPFDRSSFHRMRALIDRLNGVKTP
jgi:hypothetical protein